ncbi:MAG: M3 family oligoendopeptidase [Acholeplasmatales bacterium]|jgi:pepF/M3 family oligoendopeptidase|nr:M3 family oligoendopeptidase [Acholeplasmatales bacterium]
MDTNWNLNSLYSSFEGKYEEDFKKAVEAVKEYTSLVMQKVQVDASYIENVLKLEEKLVYAISPLSGYPSLIQASDVNNSEASKNLAKCYNLYSLLTEPSVVFTKKLKKVDLESLRHQSSYINEYYHLLTTRQVSAFHMLSDKEEILYSKISELSSNSWSDLQSLATANITAIFRGEEKTLSEIRNLAYDSDALVRKEAYEVELESYKNVEKFVALGLSNIKRETVYINSRRGYKNPLENTLVNSNMTKKSLDALMGAIRDYRKVFAKYLKAKATYLGYKGSLPFYDMFAPVGKISKTYTYSEATDLVKSAYYSFSDKLGDFSKKAIENSWIDVYPKKGKVGGAFCSGIPSLKESRVLTNFTGVLSDCLTLAHELGHAYHDEVIYTNATLNQDYPMQLAETASIFCETIMNNFLLSKIEDKEERLAILENSVQDSTQVIIDILSRYIFETNLIKASDGPLSSDELKEMMIEAQKEAYLDGLDHNLLHPYMWLCKGHYYSANYNFYNFPYAFGLLYGKGLYASYKKDNKAFIASYDKMLQLTGKDTAENVALSMGIDITKKDFWVSSLNEIKEQIDEVISLFKELKVKK